MTESTTSNDKPFSTPEGVVDHPVDERITHVNIMGSIAQSHQEQTGPVPGRE